MGKVIIRPREPGDWRDADAVDHPAHYTSHPSGVECITVTEHMSFLRGNAMKYLWRAGEKGDALTDLRKARWYLDREIANLEAAAMAPEPAPDADGWPGREIITTLSNTAHPGQGFVRLRTSSEGVSTWGETRERYDLRMRVIP
jgi:uncharacterized protein DUF3310